MSGKEDHCYERFIFSLLPCLFTMSDKVQPFYGKGTQTLLLYGSDAYTIIGKYNLNPWGSVGKVSILALRNTSLFHLYN